MSHLNEMKWKYIKWKSARYRRQWDSCPSVCLWSSQISSCDVKKKKHNWAANWGKCKEVNHIIVLFCSSLTQRCISEKTSWHPQVCCRSADTRARLNVTPWCNITVLKQLWMYYLQYCCKAWRGKTTDRKFWERYNIADMIMPLFFFFLKITSGEPSLLWLLTPNWKATATWSDAPSLGDNGDRVFVSAHSLLNKCVPVR